MAPKSWGRVARTMPSPFRHPKTGMWWFRQSVPKALRLPVGTILGRPDRPCWELKWTLGTHDLREAKQRLPAANAILQAARNGASPLTHRHLHALAGLWYQRKLKEWEVDPRAADAWDYWDEATPTDPYVEGTEDDEHPVESAQWRRDWARFLALFLPEVSALLASEGVVTDAASENRLAELIVERLPQALQRHRRRQGGDSAASQLSYLGASPNRPSGPRKGQPEGAFSVPERHDQRLEGGGGGQATDGGGSRVCHQRPDQVPRPRRPI
jgi:hypothetical protein